MSIDRGVSPSWGVVMPFYRDSATIDACLSSFLQQTCVPDEIIVTDDGSLSASDLEALQRRFGPPVVFEQRAHGGQSVATNHGLRRARSDFVLLTCADIIAPRNLLQLHREAHAERPDAVAVLGPLPYAHTVPMTPLMRYLAMPGVQFCFNEMTDPEHVNPMHCYAPNVSMARAALLQVGLFDEAFTYGLQDVDLGHRLGTAGMRFVLEPRAYAYHARGTTLPSYLQRQRNVGRATVRWLEKYPDAAMAAQLAGAVRGALMAGHTFDTLVAQAQQVYAPYDHVQALPASTYAELFKYFGGWFGMAAGLGALEQRERLRALRPLYKALRQIELAPM